MAPGLILLAALSIVPFIAIIAMSFSRVGLIGGVKLDTGRASTTGRGFSPTRTVGVAGCARSSTSCSPSGWRWSLGIGIALCVLRVVLGPEHRALAAADADVHGAGRSSACSGRFLTDSTFGLYAWVLRETRHLHRRHPRRHDVAPSSP